MAKPLKVGARVKRRNDGQRGFIVEQDGKFSVRLDRKAESLIFPYSEHAWLPDEDDRLTPFHVATVCYAADRELRSARGQYGVKEFRELREQERIAWLQGPPPDADADRWRLYHAVKGALAT